VVAKVPKVCQQLPFRIGEMTARKCGPFLFSHDDPDQTVLLLDRKPTKLISEISSLSTIDLQDLELPTVLG
jgi:hypothetical protein